MSTLDNLNLIFQSVLHIPELVLEPQMATGDLPGWDSFKNVEIILECELFFGIRFRAKDLDVLRTIADLVNFIDAKRLG
jgi:acyl carrier protein